MHPGGRLIAVTGFDLFLVSLGRGIVSQKRFDEQVISACFNHAGSHLLCGDRHGAIIHMRLESI